MFLGPHKIEIIIILLVFGTAWNLGLLWFPKTLPTNFELFPTETWDFFDFLTTPTPPLFGPFPKFPHFLVWKASLILVTFSGFCASYCTYNLMDLHSNKVVGIWVAQKNMVNIAQ